MLALTTLGSFGLDSPTHSAAGRLVHEPVRFAVLVLVACSRNGFATRDLITGILWPDCERSRARNALRQAVHRIRTLLGAPVLVTHGNGDLSLNLEEIDADMVRFAAACRERRCREALDLYGGTFLEGFVLPGRREFDDWLGVRREEFRAMARGAAVTLAAQADAEGNLEEAAELWARAGDLSDYDEVILRQRMRCLGQLGAPGRALQVFKRERERIASDLDAPTAPETQRLADAIRDGVLGAPI